MPATLASEIDFIAELYEFREPEEVRAFLARHPYLSDILERAPEHIKRVFGEHARRVFLQTHFDVEEGRESLWIQIQVDLDWRGAREYLSRFDRSWWLKNASPFFGILEADTEFIPRVRS